MTIIKTDKAKDGSLIIKLVEKKNGEEQIHYLSSHYAPLQEAKRLLTFDKEEEKKINCIFLFGIGNFYLTQLILEKYFFFPIILIENHLEVRKIFLLWLKKNHPKLAIQCKKKTDLFWCNEKTDDQEIKNIFKTTSIKNLQFIYNKKEIELSPIFFSTIKEKIIKINIENSVNRKTFSRFEKLWLRNITKNTTKIIESYPLLLFKKLGKGKTCVVIGAGPSLRFNLETLKKKQNQLFIIACDTICKVLLKNNIKPDMVVVIDPQKINSKYLENISPKDSNSIILVCEPSVCNQGIRDFPMVVMFDTLFPYYQLLSKFFNYKGQIDIGGSVTTAAHEICSLFEFDHIAYLGLDLSYQAEAYHHHGTMYEEYFFSVINRTQTFEMFFSKIINNDQIPIQNHLNEWVFTDKKFLIFRDWFEKKIDKAQQNSFNCSWGGILISTLPFKKFDDFIQDIPKLENKKNLTSTLQKSIIDYHKIMNLENEDFKKVFYNLQENYLLIINALQNYRDTIDEAINLIKNKTFKQSSQRLNQLQDQIRKGKDALLAKPFVEIVIQKTLDEISNESFSYEKDKELKSVRFLYTKLLEACELNLKYLKKAKFKQTPILLKKIKT